MKNKYIHICALSSLVLMASCKDVLDVEPYDRISEEIIWSSKANAETFIFGSYGIMERYNSGPGQDVYTSNTLANDGTASNAFQIFREIISNTYNAGFDNWAQVRRCNMIIQKVAESAGISDEDKKALIAEGKFLRAMSYYDVARKIGRIVWIDKVLTEKDELLLPTTASPSESYNYIIKDLEDAVQDLPKTKIAGRTNKYTAAAFLTEVCLQALAYKNYPNAVSVSANDPLLDKVITNANLVINEGGYTLESDYEGMFNQSKSTSSEIIFAVYKKAINTIIQSTPMQLSIPNISIDKIKKFEGSPLFNKPVPFECWPEHFPAQNLADAYLTIDKADPTKALPWNETSQYEAAVNEGVNVMIPHSRNGFPFDKVPKAPDENVLVQGKIKAGSSETLWTLNNENRDARWQASILSDSSSFYGQIMTMTMRGNSGRWISINGGDWGATSSNMYWRKGMYTNVSPSFLNTVTTDYHYVSMRLGRVILNLAEAYLLKNDVVNATLNFNKTRVIHGQLPASTAGNIKDAWKDYKIERRVDLVGENDYYYSLLRWGRFGANANNGNPSGGTIQELTEPIRVMDISKDRKSFAIVTGPFNNAYNQRIFKPERRYLFPIPQSFIDNNPNFAPQNPNW